MEKLNVPLDGASWLETAEELPSVELRFELTPKIVLEPKFNDDFVPFETVIFTVSPFAGADNVGKEGIC